MSNGSGVANDLPTNGDSGTEAHPDEPQPITILGVLERLDREEAERTPPGFPEPYKIGNQEYPGNALWNTTKTPEEEAMDMRALSRRDPPHVLAERAAANDD